MDGAMKRGSNLFVRLPAELRNRIYDSLFIFPDGLAIAVQGKYECCSGICDLELEVSSAFAGIGHLRTCRGIHAEATDVLYRTNTFKPLVGPCTKSGLFQDDSVSVVSHIGSCLARTRGFACQIPALLIGVTLL